MRPHTAGPSHALETAITMAGGLAKLARLLGVSPSAVSKWARLGRIPAERVLTIEQITLGEVSRHDLRPDLYPRDQPRHRLVRPGAAARPGPSGP